ncbi:hypothetical protein [Vallicoccus soli]|uniref:Uncharacterized protein n=1 Tax=Vallicoccus soli TaxID=2339232 RepID=A0A3A3Z260_9ACTN|nr:hypothetical protein [Vallicoccus soli]RJK97534.1 hypothetical protein D5H78_00365 [Vallicoccus soli]
MAFLARLTAYALAGAVLGLAAGLLLRALGVVDNPFWAASAGILAGAVLCPLQEQRRRRPGG